MDIIPAAIEAFAEKYTSPESAVLKRLNRETHVKVPQAHMLSGHLQGQFLSMVSHMLQPVRILELGTYTGYSAICLAQGLQEGGILHTIDINEEREEICRRYFEEAGLSSRIKLHIGNAVDIIAGLEEVFDLVFIDADKPAYEQYYDLIWDKLRPGGFMLADNVLYHGEVLLDKSKQSTNGQAVLSFCEKVAADGRAEQLLLTLRDGLLIIRKIG
jgi:predicted O-methyltransferase YrrM